MRVPHRVIDRGVARIARPVDVNEPDPRFDQAPAQEDRLSPGVPTVAVAGLGGFLTQIEGGSRGSRSDQVERVPRVSVPRLDRAVPPRAAEVCVELCQKVAAAVDAGRGDLSNGCQPLDLVIGRGRATDEPLRIPHVAEEPGGLAGRLDVLVLAQPVREPDAG